MAIDIYIEKVEVINGIEKCTREKLIDNRDSFKADLGIGAIIVPNDYSFSSIITTTSISFGRITKQIIIPSMSLYGKTKIEGCFSFSYETELDSIGEVEMFNYTDFVAIENSNETCPNIAGFGPFETGWIDITALEGKAISMSMRRKTGSGQNAFKIEGNALILRYSNE